MPARAASTAISRTSVAAGCSAAVSCSTRDISAQRPSGRRFQPPTATTRPSTVAAKARSGPGARGRMVVSAMPSTVRLPDDDERTSARPLDVRFLTACPSSGRLGYELLHQGLDPPADLVADRPDLFDRQPSGVGYLPIEIALAGVERAGITAAHGDDDSGGLDDL